MHNAQVPSFTSYLIAKYVISNVIFLTDLTVERLVVYKGRKIDFMAS